MDNDCCNPDLLQAFSTVVSGGLNLVDQFIWQSLMAVSRVSEQQLFYLLGHIHTKSHVQ